MGRGNRGTGKYATAELVEGQAESEAVKIVRAQHNKSILAHIARANLAEKQVRDMQVVIDRLNRRIAELESGGPK